MAKKKNICTSLRFALVPVREVIGKLLIDLWPDFFPPIYTPENQQQKHLQKQGGKGR